MYYKGESYMYVLRYLAELFKVKRIKPEKL